MTWLAWRRFRAQAAVAGGTVLVLVITLVVTRPHVVEVYGPSGDGVLEGLFVWLRLLGTGLIGVPAVLGAFWGAPMVAGEIEAGTHRLAWMQSIGRGRWLAAKLAVSGGVAVAAVALFAWVFTWWCAPLDASSASRIGPANFGQRGIVPIGYTLFGLALGALLGTVIRRTLPAMAATLAAFVAVRMAVQKVLRAHLVAATTVPTDPFGAGPRGGWALSSHVVDGPGHQVSGQDLESHLTTACGITRATPDVDAALATCAHRLGFRELTRTIPASSFWQLQVVESAVFAAIAALLAVVTFWWIRHRTA